MSKRTEKMTEQTNTQNAENRRTTVVPETVTKSAFVHLKSRLVSITTADNGSVTHRAIGIRIVVTPRGIATRYTPQHVHEILDLLEYATVTGRTAVAYVSASLKSGDRAEIIDAHDALTTAVDSITERLERTCFHAQISYDTARRELAWWRAEVDDLGLAR